MSGWTSLFSYRYLVYGATLLTGFAALCGQVVWQKYLAVLVGSEARSMSLVVALFLLGLASGYYFFGRLTKQREWPRFRLLKIYGYIEWATAIYLFSFHLYYQALEHLSFHSPAILVIDLLIAFLALFFPTFLMGASIPLLTATLPDRPEEINSIHSQIYGWNTLGAFAGTLVAGFYLVPSFGFSLTLIIAGAVNFLAALVFIGNSLDGRVQKKENILSIPSALSNKFYMIFTFLTGAVVISLEILFVRLLNVSAGAGIYNFPIILSLFVGGLGLGSLLLPKKVSPGFLIWQVVLSIVFLGTAYVTGPYWSIWINHIRVTLTTIPFNWYIFKAEIWLFLFCFIFPLAFFMGRLLPLSYYFLKKRKDNYGALCGSLYFCNTLGTVFGAVIIGYLAFYIFNLDLLFKINLAVLIVLAGIIAFWEKKKIIAGCAAVCLILLIPLPRWDRTGHVVGYFRQRVSANWHFKKLFNLPVTEEKRIAFFDDGPNSTVSILSYKKEADRIQRIQRIVPEITGFYSVIVNGKSDGHSLNDFSTVVLLSSLGYLFLPDSPHLSSAVIGLGTGISAGLLGKMKDMREVVVLEISPSVISGLKSLPFYKFDVMSNPKIEIIERDAFRYFTGTDKKFDFILSEPSNPWVMGVENLFSREFYQLTKDKLNEGGVLAQWVHIYSMDVGTFRMICQTIKQKFKYVEIYLIGRGDMVILASQKAFRWGETLQTRFRDPVLFPLHRAFGFFQPEDLLLVQVLDSGLFDGVDFKESGIHSLAVPKLTYRADKAFFLGKSIALTEILSGPVPSPSWMAKARVQQFKKYLQDGQEIHLRCLGEIGFNFFCSHISHFLNEYNTYKDHTNHINTRFRAYEKLRILGLIEYDEQFMQEVKKWIVRAKIQTFSTFVSYIHQTFSMREYSKIQEDLSDFQLNDLVRKNLDGYLNLLRNR